MKQLTAKKFGDTDQINCYQLNGGAVGTAAIYLYPGEGHQMLSLSQLTIQECETTSTVNAYSRCPEITKPKYTEQKKKVNTYFIQ